jgi:hypothetical protein
MTLTVYGSTEPATRKALGSLAHGVTFTSAAGGLVVLTGWRRLSDLTEAAALLAAQGVASVPDVKGEGSR